VAFGVLELLELVERLAWHTKTWVAVVHQRVVQIKHIQVVAFQTWHPFCSTEGIKFEPNDVFFTIHVVYFLEKKF